jgi:hypothetical protein
VRDREICLNPMLNLIELSLLMRLPIEEIEKLKIKFVEKVEELEDVKTNLVYCNELANLLRKYKMYTLSIQVYLSIISHPSA